MSILACLAASLVLAPQQTAPAKSSLSVLYVGEKEQPERTSAFATFLGRRFERARLVIHETFDEDLLADTDVVLLDWHLDMGAFPPERTPLGERGEWTVPTVLLGSAGLYVACAWEALGGSG